MDDDVIAARLRQAQAAYLAERSGIEEERRAAVQDALIAGWDTNRIRDALAAAGHPVSRGTVAAIRQAIADRESRKTDR